MSKQHSSYLRNPCLAVTFRVATGRDTDFGRDVPRRRGWLQEHDGQPFDAADLVQDRVAVAAASLDPMESTH